MMHPSNNFSQTYYAYPFSNQHQMFWLNGFPYCACKNKDTYAKQLATVVHRSKDGIEMPAIGKETRPANIGTPSTIEMPTNESASMLEQVAGGQRRTWNNCIPLREWMGESSKHTLRQDNKEAFEEEMRTRVAKWKKPKLLHVPRKEEYMNGMFIGELSFLNIWGHSHKGISMYPFREF